MLCNAGKEFGQRGEVKMYMTRSRVVTDKRTPPCPEGAAAVSLRLCFMMPVTFLLIVLPQFLKCTKI